jgi:hypothetical protein
MIKIVTEDIVGFGCSYGAALVKWRFANNSVDSGAGKMWFLRPI